MFTIQDVHALAQIDSSGPLRDLDPFPETMEWRDFVVVHRETATHLYSSVQLFASLGEMHRYQYLALPTGQVIMTFYVLGRFRCDVLYTPHESRNARAAIFDFSSSQI